MNSLLPEQLELWSAIVLIGISFLTSTISAAFGLGGGVAMLIALLTFVPPAIALPVHAIIQIGSNAGRATMLRKHIMPPVVAWFLPGIIVGVLVGSQVFVNLPTQWLQALLAAFILWSLWAPDFRARAIDIRTYFVVGAATSFGSMFLGATGPLLGAFLTPDRYGRDATVSTHAVCMTFQHLFKIIAFGFLGFVILAWMPLLLAMIASGFLGTIAGGSVLKKIPEAKFRMAFRFILSLLAIRLLVKSLFS